MVLRGLVMLCPLTPLDTTVFSSSLWSGGYATTWTGSVVPRPSTRYYGILLLVFERRVWSYGYWCCCAPSLPLDTAVYSRSDGGGEGMVLRGLVLLCPLAPLDTTVSSC